MGWVFNATSQPLHPPPFPEITQYPLYRRLGEPQGPSWLVRKVSPPPRFDTPTVQPVASRYTDYAEITVFKPRSCNICTHAHHRHTYRHAHTYNSKGSCNLSCHISIVHYLTSCSWQPNALKYYYNHRCRINWAGINQMSNPSWFFSKYPLFSSLTQYYYYYYYYYFDMCHCWLYCSLLWR
jgi:hypothetical protein